MAGEPVAPRVRPLEVHATVVDGEEVFLVRDPLGIMPEPALVPPAVAFLLQLLDGTRTLAEVGLRFTLETGASLPLARLKTLVGELDQALFLEGSRFDEALTRAIAEFRDQPVRPAALAGTGYPEEPGPLLELLREIVACGPPSLFVAGAPPLRGLVAPHIDLERGRAGYGAAYRRLAEEPKADLYLLLGTSHGGASSLLVPTAKDFATPLGLARTDRSFLAGLERVLPPAARAEEFLHRQEHSLEFQVLFLQALFLGEEVRIAPLLTGPLPVGSDGVPGGHPEVERVVAALKGALAGYPGRVVAVAGADLAHVGPRFGDDGPAGKDRLAALEAADGKTLELVAAGRAEELHRDVAAQGDPRRICGLSPLYLLLRSLEPCRGRVLHYGQAADPEGSQCVTFGALALA